MRLKSEFALASSASDATSGAIDCSVGPDTCPSTLTAKINNTMAPSPVPNQTGTITQTAASRMYTAPSAMRLGMASATAPP